MRSALHSGALIEAWLDTLRPPQRALAEQLRATVRAAAPVLAPSIKWGNLVYSHQRRHVVAVAVHRERVHLQVFNGAAIAAKYPVLEGAGRDLRQLRLRPGQPPDLALVDALVRASVAALADGPVGGSVDPSVRQ